MFTVYKDNMQLSAVLFLTEEEYLYMMEELLSTFDESPCDVFGFLALKLLFAKCGMHRSVLAQQRTHFTAAKKTARQCD